MNNANSFVDFYRNNPKSIEDLTLKIFTLKDMEDIFTNLGKEVKDAYGDANAYKIVLRTYETIRANVMENFINEYFGMAQGTTMISALEKAKAKSEAKLAPTPAPTPKSVESELPVYPGQIISLFLDSDREFRVIDVDESGFVTLVGLFSIGEVDELEDCYEDSASDTLCREWFEKLPAWATKAMRTVFLPDEGSRFVHAPIMTDIIKALDLYNAGCYDWLWKNDKDMSSFRVITNDTHGTSVMRGEDGEVCDYIGGGFDPFEVHPSFIINLRQYNSFIEDPEERKACKENYEEVNAI